MTKVTQINIDEIGGPGRRRIHLREISGDSEAPLETVGQDLRAARLRRGDDLATVSRALKIRKDHLEAVEEDQFDDLPGKTYAIGFVRSYSGYLGLDSAQTVERYKQEISGRHDEQLHAEHAFHNEEPRRLPSGWRIVAGVVGLALIYGVWHLLSAGPAPQPVPPAPSLAAPRPQVIAAAPPASNSKQVPTPPAESGLMSSGDPAATSARAIPSPAVPAVPAAQSGAGQLYGKLNVNSRVMLRARGDTRVTVRGEDGTLYLNRYLKAGDSYQVPDLPGLSFATSNAGAVDVVMDGVNMGRVGQNQQILGRVSLDPQSLVDRFNSH